MAHWYFEDIEVGASRKAGPYLVSKNEIVQKCQHATLLGSKTQKEKPLEGDAQFKAYIVDRATTNAGFDLRGQPRSRRLWRSADDKVANMTLPMPAFTAATCAGSPIPASGSTATPCITRCATWSSRLLSRKTFSQSGRSERPWRVDDAIGQAEKNGDLFFMPEAQRVTGCALLRMSKPRVDDAETRFRRSIELSRRQAARAWELRTAIDLAALLADQGRRDDAWGLLQPIFEQFVEGPETADLKTNSRSLADLQRPTWSLHCGQII
jgi:hypothetical protein